MAGVHQRPGTDPKDSLLTSSFLLLLVRHLLLEAMHLFLVASLFVHWNEDH